MEVLLRYVAPRSRDGTRIEATRYFQLRNCHLSAQVCLAFSLPVVPASGEGEHLPSSMEVFTSEQVTKEAPNKEAHEPKRKKKSKKNSQNDEKRVLLPNSFLRAKDLLAYVCSLRKLRSLRSHVSLRQS